MVSNPRFPGWLWPHGFKSSSVLKLSLGELGGIFPQIDWIFLTATLKHSKGKDLVYRAEILGLGSELRV